MRYILCFSASRVIMSSRTFDVTSVAREQDALLAIHAAAAAGIVVDW